MTVVSPAHRTVVETRRALAGTALVTCWLLARPAHAAPDTARPAEEPVDVVITGRRSEERLGESAVAVEVITREQIVTSGARDAAQVLANQAGIQVSSSFAGDSVQMQGLDPQHTLILVDGERMIGARDGALDLTRLFAGDIERIEIVRGPASAIYGSDAIAGVVNIITRAPRAKLGAEAQGRYGLTRGSERVFDPLGHQGDVWLSAFGGSEHFRARGNVAYRHNAAYDLAPATPATTGNQLDSVSGNLRASYVPNDNFNLPMFARATRRQQQGIDQGAGGAIYDRTQRSDDIALTALPTWSLRRHDKLTLAANYSYLRSQYLRDQRRDDDGDIYEDANEQLGTLRVQSDAEALAELHITSGIEGLLQRFVSPRLSDPGTRGRISPYAQVEWKLGAKLTIVPSARVDVDTQYGLNLSPRLALRADPLSWLTLRGAVGRGFRAPSFTELLLDFANPAVGYRVSGNQDLKPERSIGSSLSAELHGIDWVSATLNLFRNDLRDLIDTKLIRVEAGEQLYSYWNFARVRTQGIESSLQFRPLTGLLLELNYTLTDTRDLEAKRPLSGRARHRGSLRVVYHVQRFTVSARCLLLGERKFYIDSDTGTEVIRAAPTAVADARAALRIGDYVEPFLSVENAGNAGNSNTPLRPTTVYAGLDLHY